MSESLAYQPSKWDVRFLQLAAHISEWSKDPSTQVGTVIANDLKLVVGMGYNGFPRGVADSHSRYTNREAKYARIVHGETNAILNAIAPVRGATMYQWPLPPCQECAKLIIQSGIKRVVSGNRDIDRWRDSIKITQEMFDEARVILDFVDVDHIYKRPQLWAP